MQFASEIDQASHSAISRSIEGSNQKPSKAIGRYQATLEDAYELGQNGGALSAATIRPAFMQAKYRASPSYLSKKQSSGLINLTFETRLRQKRSTPGIDFNRMLPKQASEYPHRQASNKTFLVTPRVKDFKSHRKSSFRITKLDVEKALRRNEHSSAIER